MTKVKKTFEHKDLLKQDIVPGAYVAFCPPDSKELMIGKVIRLSALGATMEYGKGATCNRPKLRIVVVTEQVEIAKDKYPEEYI
jgi:hypothetical protein